MTSPRSERGRKNKKKGYGTSFPSLHIHILVNKLLVGLVLALALGLVVEEVVVVRLSQGKWKRQGYGKSGFGSLVKLLG